MRLWYGKSCSSAQLVDPACAQFPGIAVVFIRQGRDRHGSSHVQHRALERRRHFARRMRYRGGPGGGSGRAAFYQAVGDRLTHWDVNVDDATLTRRGSITLPSNVQYAWPHPSRRYLYVSTSDAASGNAPNPGKVHRLCAVRVGTDGALATARRAAGAAAAPHPQQRGRHRRVRAHLLQQSQQPDGASHQRRRNGRRAGAAGDEGRHRHLRAPDSRHAGQSRGGPRHARQPAGSHEGGRSRRAEDLSLQRRPAFPARQPAGRRQGRPGLRPAAPGFSSGAAVGLRVGGIPEPAAHAPGAGRQPGARARVQARPPRSATTTSASRSPPAASTCIRTAARCTCRTARTPRWTSTASACSAAARTTSRCSPSTRHRRAHPGAERRSAELPHPHFQH